MARPREFDVDAVLDRAMRLFWERGYQATSLDDLLEATGLSKQSLYNAFGGKRELFLKALDLYRCQRLPALRELLAGSGRARALVERAVREAAERKDPRECPLGCLMANTALELGSHDPEIAAEVRKMMLGYEKILSETIARGQREGEITTRHTSSVIAQSLRNTLDGVAILQKAGASSQRIRAVVDMALDSIRA